MLQTYDVPATEMHCLFDRHADIEILPEPFRMQATVCLRVAFSEYRNYIVATRADSQIKLSSDRSRLLSLAITGSSMLYRYYLRDVGFAIVKEVLISERHSRDATIIVPVASEVQPRSVINYAQMAVYSQDAKQCLVKDLMDAGFVYAEPVRTKNQILCSLATVLYKLSYAKDTPNVISLAYPQ